MDIKWINTFAIINEIAANKILKKYIKEHFKIKDNVVHKNVLIMLEQFEFIKRKNIAPLVNDIKVVYAQRFTQGDLKLASKVLEG